MELIKRPRRLRGSANLRKMVRETRMDKSSLIYPLFVMEGNGIQEEIPSMEGQYRYSLDRLPYKLEQLEKAGVNSIMLFGIPDHKDEVGSGAYAQDGIVQKALREAKSRFPEMYYVTDVCMCEYTSHGHCGVLCGHDVDNDKTLELLAKTALSHAQAGSDMIAPSDMMDGRVAAIRKELDLGGYTNIPIMSYAVKYASAFYGPFRDAAFCTFNKSRCFSNSAICTHRTVYTARDSFYRSLKKLLRLCHYPILPSSIIFAISSAK